MATSVNISQLSIPQLESIGGQLEEEIQLLTSSMQQLKTVQQKLKDSKESLNDIKPENNGKTMLVPLTGSMYVPGKLKDCDTVLVDIGTGYYVEKDGKGAKEFFERKINYVTKNLEKLQQTLLEKHKMRESVVTMLQMKLMALRGQGKT